MTLLEISYGYTESAALIRGRILELRQSLKVQEDPLEILSLQQRIRTLTPLWREMREMARRTAHYYDRERRRL